MGDPDWAVEAKMAKADVWESRAIAELDRARAAEADVEKLKKRIYDLEGYVALAAGSTMEEAALAFCEMKWPGEKVTDLGFEQEDVTEAKDPKRLGWRARCYVDGTGMKIDGHQLPGGFVVDGWV